MQVSTTTVNVTVGSLHYVVSIKSYNMPYSITSSLNRALIQLLEYKHQPKHGDGGVECLLGDINLLMIRQTIIMPLSRPPLCAIPETALPYRAPRKSDSPRDFPTPIDMYTLAAS